MLSGEHDGQRETSEETQLLKQLRQLSHIRYGY